MISLSMDGILMTVWPIKPISMYQPSHSSARLMCSSDSLSWTSAITNKAPLYLLFLFYKKANI